MEWRARLGKKLVSLEQAMSHVQSRHVVNVAPYSCTPMTLCEGLKAHALAKGLRDIRIEHLAAFVSWTEPQFKGVFRLFDNYATPPNRTAAHSGGMDYLPIGLWRSHELPAGLTMHPDVFLVPVSPPDAKGFCSFGPGVWMSQMCVRQAKFVIAEVQEDFIRTGGENFVHVDQIDLFVEGRVPAGGPAAAGPQARCGAD